MTGAENSVQHEIGGLRDEPATRQESRGIRPSLETQQDHRSGRSL